MNALQQIIDGMRFQNPLIPPPEDLPRAQVECLPQEHALSPTDLGILGTRSFSLSDEETTRNLTNG